MQGSCCGSSVPLLLILLEHSPVTPLAKALIRSPSLGSQDGLLFIMRLCSSRHYDTAGGIFSAVSGQARPGRQMPMLRASCEGSAQS